MVDPLSLFTGVGLASFVGNMLYDGVKSAGKEVAKKAVEDFKGETLARVAGAYGLATNHDAEKAIRRAQMAALRYLLTQYEQNLPKSEETGAQFVTVFTDAGFAFADECTVKCDRETLELREDVISALEKSLDATLASVPVADIAARAASLRHAAAQAVFGELQADLAARGDQKTGKAIVVPSGFRALFFDGGTAHDDKRIENWHDAFMLQAADALKGPNPKFEKIFAATRLAATAELALDTNEIVRLTQTVVNQSALLLAQNTHRLAAIESAIRTAHKENMGAHDQTHGKLGEILRLMQADQARKAGLDPRVLTPIFERLGKKDLGVEDMQAQAESAVAAFLAYVDGKIEKTNLGEDIDQAISEARELLRTTGFEAANVRLEKGVEKERNAIAEAQEQVRDHVRRAVALLAEQARMRGVALDYAGARSALTQILGVDPENVWALVERGDIEIATGTTEAALADFRAALAFGRDTRAERSIGLALDKIGDVLVSRNDLAGALTHYQEGLEIRRRLAQADPTHGERARDVSVSLERIGDVLRSRNDLDGALRHYQEGLEIRRRLAQADPTHGERARDVSVSVNKIGDVLRSRNDLAGALRHYQEGLEISRRLAQADPTHGERARDVSVSVNKIGHVLVSRNDLEGALRYYQEDLEISQRLAQADPSHANRAHDVAISLIQIGSVHRTRGDRRDACANFREAHAIVAALAVRASDIHVLQEHLQLLDAMIAESCDGEV